MAAAHIGLDLYLERVRAHDVGGLRRALAQARARLGLARFVVELISPLSTLIGDAWMRGQLAIFEEHPYSESLQAVLRKAIAAPPAAARCACTRLSSAWRSRRGAGVPSGRERLRNPVTGSS